jgi:hypothetical protein
MTSSASTIEAERDTDEAREKLAATLAQLRENLLPHNLVDEAVERVAGPQGSAITGGLEAVIRRYPLPMMLLGMGTAMWLSSAWQRRGSEALPSTSASPSEPAAAPNESLGPLYAETPPSAGTSLKESIAEIGRSVADSAYEALRARATAKIDAYTKTATGSIEAATNEMLDSVEETLDRTVANLASVLRARPVTFSLIALILGTAIGGFGRPRNSGGRTVGPG